MMMLLFVLMMFAPAAKSASVVPNFTRGTVTSTTESFTSVTEIIRQIDYSTGESYTVTGTNMNIPPNPGVDSVYTVHTPGQPFQFTETYLGPGVASELWIERTTETTSSTSSLSVFTQ